MKPLMIGSFALIASFCANAFDPIWKEVNVLHNENKIILAGDSCELLNKEGVALSTWSKKLNELDITESSCVCKKGYCKKDVTTLLPKFVKNNYDRHMYVIGPNSFNTALQASKITSQFRYASGTEMNFWMNSKLCHEKSTHEPLESGDLALIRSWKNGDLFGYVHITENLAFSKNSFLPVNSYYLQSPIALLDKLEVPQNCRKTGGTPKECPIWVNHFSCQTFDAYLKTHPIISDQAKKSYAQFVDIEKQVGNAVEKNAWNDPTVRSALIVTLVELNNLALEIIKSKKFHEKDKIIWQAIFHMTKSINGQLDHI